MTILLQKWCKYEPMEPPPVHWVNLVVKGGDSRSQTMYEKVEVHLFTHARRR